MEDNDPWLLRAQKDALLIGFAKMEELLAFFESKPPEEATECGCLPPVEVLDIMDRMLGRLSERLPPDEFAPLSNKAVDLFDRLAVVAKNHIIMRHGGLQDLC